MRAVVRPSLVVVASVFLFCGAPRAQNGSSYHILTNGPDVIIAGVDAGGSQTADDGLGTWIAGEDLKGSHMTNLGEFGYRMPGFRESLCVLGPAMPGTLHMGFPLLAFVEFDGLNGNTPPSSPTRSAPCPASHWDHPESFPTALGQPHRSAISSARS